MYMPVYPLCRATGPNPGSSGTGSAGGIAVSPCGQMGRSVQACTSATLPMAPDHTISATGAFLRSNSPDCPSGSRPCIWSRLPAVAAPPKPCASAASDIYVLAALHTPGAAVACMKSGMATMTASIAPACSSSMRRKSLYFGTLSYCLNFPEARTSSTSQSATIFSPEQTEDITGRFASRANGGDIQFLIGRFVAEHLEIRRAAESRGRNGASEQGSEEKVSSGKSVVCHKANEAGGLLLRTKFSRID